MSTLIQDIIKVAKVSETEALEIENVIMCNFDLDSSEASQRTINSTIREAVRFMNMKCNHPKGTQHTWECVK